MNNDYFRKLVQNTPARQDGADSTPRATGASSTLGSKRSSFIPMTPRTVRGGVPGNDFARQVAERNAAGQASKKFKTAAPRGSKLARGFNDRTQERYDDEADEKAARIKALEEQVKLGQLDEKTFEALRDQITGGDVGATHLVKGLDRRLLERVRRGEDVLGTGGQVASEEDLEAELEELEALEVKTIEKERVVKKGDMAPPPSVAGAKRSRNQILADLKAQRQAQAEAKLAARPELGSKFRPVGAPSRAAAPRVERDEKGREVMVTVDEHGNVKKKVRKVQPAAETATQEEKPHKFLDEGITVPPPKPVEKPAEQDQLDSDDDDDIFEGAGTSYDPLGDVDSDHDDSDDESKPAATEPPKPDTEAPTPTLQGPKSPSAEAQKDTSMPPPPLPSKPSAPPRNYFQNTASEPTDDATPAPTPFNDTAFLAAIKKAGALSAISLNLDSTSTDENGQEDPEAKEARLRKRAQMLAAHDRDLDDMDMGFGSSRFGDAEEEEGGEGKKVKLSQWKGNKAGGDDDDEGLEENKEKKKKKGKKRKGDKNSAADILGVIERRKEGGK